MKEILTSLANVFAFCFFGAVGAACLLAATSSIGMFFGTVPVPAIALSVFFVLAALVAGTLTGNFTGLFLVPAFAIGCGSMFYVRSLMGSPDHVSSFVDSAKLQSAMPWVFVAACAIAAAMNIGPAASESQIE